MVADPEASARAELAEAVERAGDDLDEPVSIHQAGDGTTALALCSDYRPRLLVAEVLLDGLSGLALLRTLRASNHATTVVFVTEMFRDADRYWALRNGAHAYLTKPVDPLTLRERIKRFLADPQANPERP